MNYVRQGKTGVIGFHVWWNLKMDSNELFTRESVRLILLKKKLKRDLKKKLMVTKEKS